MYIRNKVLWWKSRKRYVVHWKNKWNLFQCNFETRLIYLHFLKKFLETHSVLSIFSLHTHSPHLLALLSQISVLHSRHRTKQLMKWMWIWMKIALNVSALLPQFHRSFHRITFPLWFLWCYFGWFSIWMLLGAAKNYEHKRNKMGRCVLRAKKKSKRKKKVCNTFFGFSCYCWCLMFHMFGST